MGSINYILNSMNHLHTNYYYKSFNFNFWLTLLRVISGNFLFKVKCENCELFEDTSYKDRSSYLIKPLIISENRGISGEILAELSKQLFLIFAALDLLLPSEPWWASPRPSCLIHTGTECGEALMKAKAMQEDPCTKTSPYNPSPVAMSGEGYPTSSQKLKSGFLECRASQWAHEIQILNCLLIAYSPKKRCSHFLGLP